jgi:hypothetical protein
MIKTFKQWLLLTTSHETIAKLVPVTPESHRHIMALVGQGLWGR